MRRDVTDSPVEQRLEGDCSDLDQAERNRGASVESGGTGSGSRLCSLPARDARNGPVVPTPSVVGLTTADPTVGFNPSILLREVTPRRSLLWRRSRRKWRVVDLLREGPSPPISSEVCSAAAPRGIAGHGTSAGGRAEEQGPRALDDDLRNTGPSARDATTRRSDRAPRSTTRSGASSRDRRDRASARCAWSERPPSRVRRTSTSSSASTWPPGTRRVESEHRRPRGSRAGGNPVHRDFRREPGRRLRMRRLGVGSPSGPRPRTGRRMPAGFEWQRQEGNGRGDAVRLQARGILRRVSHRGEGDRNLTIG